MQDSEHAEVLEFVSYFNFQNTAYISWQMLSVSWKKLYKLKKSFYLERAWVIVWLWIISRWSSKCHETLLDHNTAVPGWHLDPCSGPEYPEGHHCWQSRTAGTLASWSLSSPRREIFDKFNSAKPVVAWKFSIQHQYGILSERIFSMEGAAL